MHHTRDSLTILVILALATGMAGATDVRYNVTPITMPQGYCSFLPWGLNDSGTVVGSILAVPGDDRVGIWSSSGVVADLGTFGQSYAWGEAINASGQIAGSSQLVTSSSPNLHYRNEAFTLQGGTPTFLGNLGTTGHDGEGTYANDINNAGQIVGASYYWDSGNYSSRGYVWENGTMTDIGIPVSGANCVLPQAINNNGVVVGYAYTPGQTATQANRQGFLWTKQNGFRILSNQLSTSGLDAYDVNDSGDVVGAYVSDSHYRPFYYNGVNMTALPLPSGATDVQATSINNKGQIVGYETRHSANGNWLGDFPILWDNGEAYHIDDLVPNGFGPFNYSYRIKINNNGQITVSEQMTDGSYRGFLLTPIPEPSTLVSLGIGAIGMLLFIKMQGRVRL